MKLERWHLTKAEAIAAFERACNTPLRYPPSVSGATLTTIRAAPALLAHVTGTAGCMLMPATIDLGIISVREACFRGGGSVCLGSTYLPVDAACEDCLRNRLITSTNWNGEERITQLRLCGTTAERAGLVLAAKPL